MNAQHYDPAKITKLRMNAGLTQKQIADELGVTSIHLSRVENGHSASYALLSRIALRFGKKVTYLLHAQAPKNVKIFSART